MPLALAIFYTFLPAGYPHTVTEDYLGYQLYDSLQAFSSSITNLLAHRAVLEGLGVGNASQSPTAALLLQIIQDTFSRLATILFAHRMGQAIEPECKFYRFLADIFNDASQMLELFIPALPFLPKVGVMVGASILRALCGVAANASKASLSAHFAKTGNLAELNAKEASQETVVSLLGMLAGTLFVRVVEGKTAVWAWMLVLVGVHLATNYRAVRSVRMRSLNRQRATIVFREWLEHGAVLSPAEVALRESILRGGRGAMRSKSGDYTGRCAFGSYGAVVGWRPWGYHRYILETDDYFMGIFHWGASFYIRIALKEGVAKDGRRYDESGNIDSNPPAAAADGKAKEGARPTAPACARTARCSPGSTPSATPTTSTRPSGTASRRTTRTSSRRPVTCRPRRSWTSCRRSRPPAGTSRPARWRRAAPCGCGGLPTGRRVSRAVSRTPIVTCNQSPGADMYSAVANLSEKPFHQGQEEKHD